jgi:hypothetical protein
MFVGIFKCRPLRLDLSPEEEVIVFMNMSTIRYWIVLLLQFDLSAINSRIKQNNDEYASFMKISS